MTTDNQSPVEIATIDDFVIHRDCARDLLLTIYYNSYNKKYFDSSLPALMVYWASRIRFPNGRLTALFVPDEMSPDKRPFIVIRKEFQGLETVSQAMPPA